MTIYSYLRYSSDNQAGGVSLEMQRTAINAYLSTQPAFKGQKLVERTDEAKSGTTLRQREGLASILRDARRDDAVVVFKLDRLGRNLYDALKVLRELEEKGVRVVSTSEPEARVVQHVLLAMAEEFSRQLGDRCKRALDGLAANGFVANHAPYGYQIERQGNRAKLAPVPKQAAIVKRIYIMRAEGFTHREITKTLNREHVPSPRSGSWSVSCVYNILRNETYRGTITNGVRIFKKGHGLIGKRPRNEWTVTRNAHPAIIDEQLWDSVRKHDSTTKFRTPTSRGKSLLVGFLKCTECGANLVLDYSDGCKYYGCQSGRDLGIKRPCQHRCLIRAEAMVEVVIDVLTRNIFGETWIEEVIGAAKKEVQRVVGSVASVLPPLEKSLRRISQQIESAERRLLVVPEDSMPVCLAELQRMKAERDELKSKIENAKNVTGNKAALGDLESALRQRIGGIAEQIRDKDTRRAREFLARIVDRVEISPTREGTMYARRGGLLALVGTERVNIPTRI